MVGVLLFFLPHLFGLQGDVALRTSLLVLGHVAFEPFLDALLVEEVTAHWDSGNDLVLIECVHADHALGRLELVVLLIEPHLLQLKNELRDVFPLLLLDLPLQVLIVALHLLDLPLEPADVIHADDVFVPVGVWLVDVEVDVVGFVDVAPHEAGHNAAAEARSDDRDCHCQDVLEPRFRILIFLQKYFERFSDHLQVVPDKQLNVGCLGLHLDACMRGHVADSVVGVDKAVLSQVVVVKMALY